MQNRIFFLLLPVLGALGLILSLGRVALDPSLSNVFYNADSLFFSVIYQELFLKSTANFLITLKGWIWTPALYFFPDLVQYFGLRTIYLFLGKGAWEATHLTYAFLQWSLVLFGILYLLKTVYKEEFGIQRSAVLLAFGYFAGSILFFFKKDLFVFLPGFHGGNLTSLSWAWAFYYQWEEKKNAKSFCVLAFFVFVFALSDLIFLPYYLVPLLSLHLFQLLRERNLLKAKRIAYFYFPIFLGIVFARIAYQALRKNPFVFFPGTLVSANVGNGSKTAKLEIYNLFHSFLVFTRENWIYLVVLLLCGTALYVLRKKEEEINARKSGVGREDEKERESLKEVREEDKVRKSREKEREVENTKSRELEFLFLSLGILVPVLFLCYGFSLGFTGREGIQEIGRYFGSILLSSLGLSFLVLRKLADHPNRRVALGILLLVLIGSLSLFSISQGIGLVYSSPKLDCLDKYARERNWKRGLASFWYVRPMRIFSQQKLEPDDYLYDLMLFYWQNNLSWFERKEQYRFAILDGLDEKKVIETFGQPKEVLNCENIKIFSFSEEDPSKSLKFVEENQEKINLWKLSNSRF
ncbi:hypothetical protein EHQ53_09610 [Leptospira langatensis]|uniref:Glycosyltransferase RgtA/B/C/D-like domain-containing protein n=1 Tax=Leptospira langatensis TaxID=2484983 RepID=A0A5F1ZSA4_9LEPT|nr:hypothetical protein [Leptospira langatensis]TGK00304.1 hypothetical protein EHO57_13580 [Leptospira langatensis]TGL41060.1 hypothetical protein EHQ53_09610 [Leptospira langatensis]